MSSKPNPSRFQGFERLVVNPIQTWLQMWCSRQCRISFVVCGLPLYYHEITSLLLWFHRKINSSLLHCAIDDHERDFVFWAKNSDQNLSRTQTKNSIFQIKDRSQRMMFVNVKMTLSPFSSRTHRSAWWTMTYVHVATDIFPGSYTFQFSAPFSYFVVARKIFTHAVTPNCLCARRKRRTLIHLHSFANNVAVINSISTATLRCLASLRRSDPRN